VGAEHSCADSNRPPPAAPRARSAAGRRGFDNRGSVVFFGLTRTRVSQLLASSLPPMVPNWTLSTTFLLRATIKAHELNEDCKAFAARTGRGAAGIPPMLRQQATEWPAPPCVRAAVGGFLPITQPARRAPAAAAAAAGLESLRRLRLLSGRTRAGGSSCRRQASDGGGLFVRASPARSSAPPLPLLLARARGATRPLDRRSVAWPVGSLQLAHLLSSGSNT